MSTDNDKIFKPRRGTKSNMTGTKSTTVLAEGELFIEVPDTGQGTGRVRIKMGDGSTIYSNLPYAISYTEDEVINHNGIDDKSITASSSIQTSSKNNNLNNAKSGNTLKDIIHNLREAIYKNACDIEYLNTGSKSYVGMIIHSTTLDTEAKVKAQYGGTTWILHDGYVLRGGTSVTANSNTKTGGNDSVSYTPGGSVSSTFSGTATTLSHSGTKVTSTFSGTAATMSHTFSGTATTLSHGNTGSTTLTTAQIPKHRHSIPSLSGTASTTSSNHVHYYPYQSSDNTAGTSAIKLVANITGYTNLPKTSSEHTHSVTTDASNTGYTFGNSSGNTDSHNHSGPSSHTYTPAGSISKLSYTPAGSISNTVTQPSNHTYTPGGSVSSSFSGTAATINTLPQYKSVYIWERTV